jgi:hypothetical protein
MTRMQGYSLDYGIGSVRHSCCWFPSLVQLASLPVTGRSTRGPRGTVPKVYLPDYCCCRFIVVIAARHLITNSSNHANMAKLCKILVNQLDGLSKHSAERAGISKICYIWLTCVTLFCNRVTIEGVKQSFSCALGCRGVGAVPTGTYG